MEFVVIVLVLDLFIHLFILFYFFFHCFRFGMFCCFLSLKSFKLVNTTSDKIQVIYYAYSSSSLPIPWNAPKRWCKAFLTGKSSFFVNQHCVWFTNLQRLNFLTVRCVSSCFLAFEYFLQILTMVKTNALIHTNKMNPMKPKNRAYEATTCGFFNDREASTVWPVSLANQIPMVISSFSKIQFWVVLWILFMKKSLIL